MPRARYWKWCVVDMQTGEAVCQRCGKRERIPLPMPMLAFAHWSRYFVQCHKFCKDTKTIPTKPQGEKK